MKKKIVIIGAVILALALASFGMTIWKARKSMTEAVEACNAAIREYNEGIEPYNEAVKKTESANEELEALLKEAQSQIDSGKKAYDEDTLYELKQQVKKASRSVVEVPAPIEPYDQISPANSFDRNELSAAEQKAGETEKAVREAIKEIPKAVDVPDYGKELSAVKRAQKAYSDSVQQLVNVTAPNDDFVAERLGRIDTVTGTAAVTEKNDPNRLLGKKGGYIGCVYFSDKRIELENLPKEVPSPETVSMLNELWPEENKEDEENADGQSGEGDTAEAASTSETASTGETAQAAAESASTGETAQTASTSETASTEETAKAATTSETASTGETAEAGTTSETASTEETAEAATTSETATTGETAEAASTSEAATTGETAKAATTSEAATTGETAAAALPEDEKTEKDKKKEKKKDLEIINAGTAGGGAVEVYSTEEEARDRDQYLAFFEGSIMDPGGHAVEGTCVIRVSRHLEETEQQELMKKIRKALLEIK